MIKKIVLVSTILLIPIENNSLAENTDSLITIRSIGKAKIGQTYYQVKRAYSNYKSEIIRETPFPGLLIKDKNSTPLLLVSSSKADFLNVKDNDNKNPINYIMTCSNKFKTKEGFGVGDSLTTLLKIYPNMMLNYNLHDEIDEFYPNNYKKELKSMSISIESSDKKLLGYYKTGKDGGYIPTNNFRKNGKISCISIYDESLK